MLVKVMKFELRYLDGCGDFENMQKELWNIQRQTRTVLNRTIQILYNWDYQNQKHHEATGEYLDVVEETGYKRIDGYVYDQLKRSYTNMRPDNMNVSIQTAWKKYKDMKDDMFKGEAAAPSYKKDQPLSVNQKSVKADYINGENIVEFSLFSKKYAEEKGYSKVRFNVLVCDDYQEAIFTRVLSGEYKLGNCQISYMKKKKSWFLFLTYKFEKEKSNLSLDANKILGLDLGEKFAVCGSIYGEPHYKALYIDGGEVTEFAKRVESRKRSMQKASVYCGNGRKGHGTSTRIANIYKIRNKIANFRATKNHIYSKAVVDYAIANNCGTIQMEDLTGIKDNLDHPMILKHWTYYDLQSKIESKATAAGIEVKKINPRYTSCRCSKCGYIDVANRKEQAKFKCLKCGEEANADWNASQNISIKDIDAIIEIEKPSEEKPKKKKSRKKTA